MALGQTCSRLFRVSDGRIASVQLYADTAAVQPAAA